MSNELTDAQREVWMFLQERNDRGEPPPTYREICARFGFASPKAAFDHATALARKGYVLRGKGARSLYLVRSLRGIPLLGRIPAGFPDETLTMAAERLNVEPEFLGIHDRSRAFAVQVVGDSMKGRRIFEGDIVVLEHLVDPHDGDVVAALIDKTITLKTFVRSEGKAWLRAENPSYPDLIPVLDLQIQGVARAVIRFLHK